MPRPRRLFPAAILALLAGVLLVPPVSAQTPSTGRIRVLVTDPQGLPVELAGLTIHALRRGGVADDKGRFVFTDVPPGTHEVEVSIMSYGTKRVTAVVTAGATAEVAIRFDERKVTQLDEIEVVAERKIDTKSSESSKFFSGEKLMSMPGVDNVIQAAALSAGIVSQGGNLHVRGGRGNEVKQTRDGIEVSDPLIGRPAGIANLAVAGAEVVSGGFDAEHGRALSGVLAITTREGGQRFGGDLRWDTDRYGDATKTFNNFDRFTVGFGGPMSIPGLTYFATYEGTFTDTHLRSSLTKPRRSLLEFIQLGNRQNNQINTNLKLAYKPSTTDKFTFETVNNRNLNTPYVHMWSRKGFVQVREDTVRTAGQPDTYTPRYGTWSATRDDSTFQPMNMPDHVPTLDDRFQQFSGVWTRQFDSSTVLTARVAGYRFDSRNSIGGKEPWEYDTESPNYWSGNTDLNSENDLFFATHGDFPFYFRREASTLALKTDLATKNWRSHTVKTGIDVRYNRVSNLALVLPNLENNGLPGGARSDYTNYHPEGSLYAQDRWEFEGLVLNAGLRYDVFTPGLQIDDADLPSGSRYKQQFSPRLGIAYPVSDRDVLSFHYGWTYQAPTGTLVFENRETNSAVAIQGNPDLEPETNIAYQAAVQHLFTRDLSGQFAVFFKDIYGLVTTRQTVDEFGNTLPYFENGDYASARGFEASLSKSFSHRFSAEVNYTYSLATGVASNPNQALQFFNGGQLYLPISEQPLNWDQRHTVSVQANVRNGSQWGFRMLWQYGSGFPFTPAFRNDRRPDPALNNSRRLPADATLTVDGDRFMRVWGQNVTLFFEARNVLDAKNVQAITQGVFPNPFVNNSGDEYIIYYTETGRAGGAYLQDTNGDGELDWVPINDPRVFNEGRNVRMGVSVAF
jgi:outer membrane receptor protein involved in Fe transport